MKKVDTQREKEKMPYLMKCYIQVNEDNPTIYKTLDEAEIDLDQAESMQPENRYEIVECDESGTEI
jgi:hypothetical protein